MLSPFPHLVTLHSLKSPPNPPFLADTPGGCLKGSLSPRNKEHRFFFSSGCPLISLGTAGAILDPTPSAPTSPPGGVHPCCRQFPNVNKPSRSQCIRAFCDRASSSLGLPIATPLPRRPSTCPLDPATGAGPGSRLLPPCLPQTELPLLAWLGARAPKRVRVSLQNALVR